MKRYEVEGTKNMLAVTDPQVFDQHDFVERLMGDEELAKQILRGFLEDIPAQLMALNRALDDGDAKAVRMTAHSIKGASASVGGLEMQEQAKRLEQAALNGDMSAVSAALPELSLSVDRAHSIMHSFCRK